MVGLRKAILPVLGIDMESAVVERWLKNEGDLVAKDEPIAIVETDKASTEILSPVAGVLRKIAQPVGATVPVTHTMALIEVEGPGDEASVGEGERERERGSEGVMVGTQSSVPSPWSSPRSAQTSSLRASPAARRVAQELSVDLSQVMGTGPAGRIQGSDVRAFAERSQRSSDTRQQSRVEAAPHPDPLPEGEGVPGSLPGGEGVAQRSALGAQHTAHSSDHSPQSSLPGRLVPLGKKRRITAERMSQSARTVARLTMNTEMDASEMVRLRTRLLPVYEKESGVRLSYNDLIVKAVATALKEHPYLNGRWTDEGIYLVDAINVGVAVAVEDGLVVPVVRDANHKKLAEIAAEIAGLVGKAREDRLSLHEMTGGTFTVTNLGMLGIDSFTPIVNPPEAAILGIGRIVEKPVGRDGEIVLRPMMGLSLSFDHRIVDGAPAAKFLQRVVHLLEEPYLLI